MGGGDIAIALCTLKAPHQGRCTDRVIIAKGTNRPNAEQQILGSDYVQFLIDSLSPSGSSVTNRNPLVRSEF